MDSVKIGQMIRFPKKFNSKGEIIMKEGTIKAIMGKYVRVKYKNKVNWAYWEGYIEQLLPYIDYKETKEGMSV